MQIEKQNFGEKKVYQQYHTSLSTAFQQALQVQKQFKNKIDNDTAIKQKKAMKLKMVEEFKASQEKNKGKIIKNVFEQKAEEINEKHQDIETNS